MSKSFYFKLAAENIKKNARTYVPFMLTCTITIAMFYIILSLSQNPGIAAMRGAMFISAFMTIGSMIVGVFAMIFLFYTNSFLLKRRKKEFGLFNILGMEKRHIAAVVFLETLYTALISLVIGISGGILLDKLMFLIISKLLDVEVTLGFYISGSCVIITALFFAAIFFMIYLNSLRQIHFSKPIELLKGDNAGEREPKTRFILAFLGLIFLGAGYYISITIENIQQAFVLFFLAVILVILGTYMLFTAGSVFILKAMRKNKRYFYKTKHFISVSGMIYRMKQNAVGLANICILSTMVLVMISTTSCLMANMNDIIDSNYPYDMTITVHRPYVENEEKEGRQKVFDEILDMLGEYQKDISRTNIFDIFNTVLYFDGNKAELDGDESTIIADVCFVTAEDYNMAFGKELELEPNEIAMTFRGGSNSIMQYEDITICGKEFRVKEKPNYFYVKNNQDNAIAEIAVIVLSDTDVMTELSDRYREFFGLEEPGLRASSVLNASFLCDEKTQYDTIIPEITGKINELPSLETSRWININSRINGKYDFLDLYGGLFFLGAFLGTLFVMAAVLIIYYKQISEGYDDKKRFEIMQNVGLSKSEVRKSIHSQVVTVFFLPLITAGVHTIAAFPILNKLLEGLNMRNTPLFIICMAVCFLIFALFYVVVYLLTAKAYYRIVSK